jgi:membrane protein implicated in regulation of membrane protease activity
LRYALIQIPGLAAVILIMLLLGRWVHFPAWIFWSLIGLWVFKDLLMFPLLKNAYDWDRAGESNPLVGATGVARDRLAPSGYVQVRGELWRSEVADGGPPVEPGNTVRVLDVQGLTLLVKAELPEAEGPN